MWGVNNFLRYWWNIHQCQAKSVFSWRRSIFYWPFLQLGILLLVWHGCMWVYMSLPGMDPEKFTKRTLDLWNSGHFANLIVLSEPSKPRGEVAETFGDGDLCQDDINFNMCCTDSKLTLGFKLNWTFRWWSWNNVVYRFYCQSTW